MEGVDIIGNLLLADAALIAVVPAERIKAGALPDNIELPALLVSSTSQTERQQLKRGPVTWTKDRVSVSVRAGSYREQRAVMQLVKACCAGVTGTVGTAHNVAVLTAGRGPDLRGPGDTYEQTQDFRVSYDA